MNILRDALRTARQTARRAALRLALRAALLAVSLAQSMAASAHEFWLEPTAFDAPAGRPIGVYVCNGSGFEGWSLPRDSARIEEFVALGPDGSQPVVGRDGSEPAGIVRLESAGGYVLAYRSNRAMTVQPDQKFDEYLQEKGLDAVLARRNAQGHRGGRVRESFSRYAKALVRVGDSSTLADRAVGLPLELVADENSSGNVDPEKTFRVLYHGKPLARALVTAMRPGTTDSGLTTRTDSDGRARFELHKAGVWRISAVHMVTPPKGVDADWDSLWASLTFELRATTRAPTGITRQPAVRTRGSTGTVREPAPRHEARCLNQVAGPLQANR
jgi:uncharacterized GH25 family protein